jgi:hypothetical protein
MAVHDSDFLFNLNRKLFELKKIGWEIVSLNLNERDIEWFSAYINDDDSLYSSNHNLGDVKMYRKLIVNLVDGYSYIEAVFDDVTKRVTFQNERIPKEQFNNMIIAGVFIPLTRKGNKSVNHYIVNVIGQNETNVTCRFIGSVDFTGSRHELMNECKKKYLDYFKMAETFVGTSMCLDAISDPEK